MNPDWINGLIGGGMIGAAAGLLLLTNGRIAGISGILGGVIEGTGPWLERALFIVGLAVSPALYYVLGGRKTIDVTSDVALLVVGGLLVGFGSRLGSGCTSGHGVCGSARLSKRSLAAMGTFMATAILTVLLVHRM